MTRTRIICGALGLALLALACREAAEIEPPAPAPPPVMVEEVRVRDVVDRIEATGELLAKASATVAAQVGGEVTRIVADEGLAVTRGQIVIEIDPHLRLLELANQRALLTQAEADLEKELREHRRISELHAQRAASQSQLDEATTYVSLARSSVASAEAMVGLAQRALSDSSVAAPFEGQIARRYVSVGEFVSSGQELFDLVDLRDLEVEFHLAEVDSGRVSVGDALDVRVAPFPDEVFGARVSVVSPTIDSRSRTLRVKAVLEEAEGRLRPGLFARVDLGVNERSGVLMVPEEAVLQRSDGSIVFRLAGGDRVERVLVQTGIYRAGEIELRSGVSAGDRVVVRGQTGVIDGSPVSVMDADGTPLLEGPGAEAEREALASSRGGSER